MYSPYKILGVKSTDKKQDIKVKYKQLCKKYHPDNLVTGDMGMFRKVSEAWKYIDENHKDTHFLKSLWKHKTLFTIYKEDK